MPNTIFLVDLPNFYSQLLKSRSVDPKLLREYFMNWLDFDLLADSLAKPHNGIWVFYSGERIGPSGDRIDGKFLHDYIRRINALKGVTAWDVNIPGEQREAIYYRCENCGHSGIAQALSEKGIDASLTVHLFDTMDSWDVAYLFSGDADFVPAVSSLRRRGKIVVGVGFSNASAALVRECYNYIDIDKVFLRQDFLLFLIFRKIGIAKQWLLDEVILDDIQQPPPNTIKFRVLWGSDLMMKLGNEVTVQQIKFTTDYKGEIANRLDLLRTLGTQFPDNVRVIYDTSKDGYSMNVYVEYPSKEAIARNIDKLLESNNEILFLRDLPQGGSVMMVDYEYDQNENKYLVKKRKSAQTP